VSRDLTFGLAVAAACLMLAGIVISLWVPQQRIWLCAGKERAQLVASGVADHAFEALAGELVANSGSLEGA
jgi:hypothetical protein